MLNLLMIILHAARDGSLTRDRNPAARQDEPSNGAERAHTRKRARPETGPRPEKPAFPTATG